MSAPGGCPQETTVKVLAFQRLTPGLPSREDPGLKQSPGPANPCRITSPLEEQPRGKGHHTLRGDLLSLEA